MSRSLFLHLTQKNHFLTTLTGEDKCLYYENAKKNKIETGNVYRFSN
jgi:hypothetical protein